MGFRCGPEITPLVTDRVEDLKNAIRQMRHEVWRADEGLNTATEALSRIAGIAIKALGEGPG